MGVKVVSAYFGDEISARDITKQLNERAAGGSINVVADSSLLPMFEATEVISLSSNDIADIRDQAVKDCGTESDVQCVEARIATNSRTRIQEKQREAQSTANQVKGRRLTVVVDDNGKRRTLIVPDGQKFELKGLETPKTGLFSSSSKSAPSKPWDFSAANIAWKTLTTGMSALGYIWTILAAFLYIFQIVAVAATLQTLESLGPFKIKYYAGLASSILIPYSGFLIMFAIYVYRGYTESSA